MKGKDAIKANDVQALEKYKLRLHTLEQQLEDTKKIEHTTAELNNISAKIRYTKIKIEELETNNKKCPKCGGELGKRPALSRRDGKTEICSECGMLEAIEDIEKTFGIKKG